MRARRTSGMGVRRRRVFFLLRGGATYADDELVGGDEVVL
jgi:hypothetical protein